MKMSMLYSRDRSREKRSSGMISLRVLILTLVCIGINLAVLSFMSGAFQQRGQRSDWTPQSGTGFVRRLYIDETGHAHRYLLFVPHHLVTNSRPPLILFLNGFGENGDDGVDHLKNTFGPQLWDLQTEFPFVVVFPQCRIGSQWIPDSPDTKRAFAMLQEIADEFQTDSDRVYLTGASTGGAGVWSIAAKYPKKFAAIAPLCGRSNPANARILAEANLPIWSFVSTGDEVPNVVTENRDMYQALLREGASPRFTEVDGSEHDCWNYVYRNPGFYEWMLQQTRSRNEANVSRFSPILDGRGIEGWKTEGEAVWDVEPNGILIGRNATKTLSRLVIPNTNQDFELHFEFQWSKDINWSLVCLGDDANGKPSDGWKLRIMPPEQGSCGLFTSDEKQCYQAGDTLAQATLRTSGWNDIRLNIVGERVAVSLNGWLLVDFQLPALAKRSGKLALELGNTGSGQISWRNLRINGQISEKVHGGNRVDHE